MAQPFEKTRLISHFENKSDDQQGSGWSELWDSGQNDLWDRGFPSPPLRELLASRPDLLNPLNLDGSRKKALVPGCGTGYDPAMLALHGFEAYGLEISETGAATARKYGENELKNPRLYNFYSDKIPEQINPGTVKVLQGDFFLNEWERGIAGEDLKFDLVYDYTFLCALLPSMRKGWSKRMSELVKPGGLLICLEFPLWKDLSFPGPPWGLKGVYWDLLARGGDGMQTEAVTEESSAEALNGKFVRELRMQPERSYQQGRGQDMLSVWRRK